MVTQARFYKKREGYIEVDILILCGEREMCLHMGGGGGGGGPTIPSFEGTKEIHLLI